MQFEQMTAGRGALTAVRTGARPRPRHPPFAPCRPTCLRSCSGGAGRQTPRDLVQFARIPRLAAGDAGADGCLSRNDRRWIRRIRNRQGCHSAGKRIRRHRRAGLCARASRTDIQAGGERCRGHLSSGRTTGLRGDGGESRRRWPWQHCRDRRQARVLTGLSCRASGKDRRAQERSARDRSKGLPCGLQNLAGNGSCAAATSPQGADAGRVR